MGRRGREGGRGKCIISVWKEYTQKKELAFERAEWCVVPVKITEDDADYDQTRYSGQSRNP